MQATYAQIQYLRDLGKQIAGNEYLANERAGISRSANLTKKLTKAEASALIDTLKAELVANEASPR